MTTGSTWTIQFVEHLRTVHFALLSLSAALIMIGATTSDRRTERAATQAKQILELTERWSEIQRKLFLKAMLDVNGPPPYSYSMILSSQLNRFQPAERSLREVRVQFVVTEMSEIPTEILWKEAGGLPLSPPHTLAQFQTWWDELRRGVKVKLPRALEMRDCLANLFVPSKARLPDQVTKWLPQEIRCEKTESSKEDQTPVHMMFPTDRKSAFVGSGDNLFVATATGHRLEVGVEVGVERTETTVFETGLQQAFADWRDGPFNAAFRELDALAGEYRYLSLKNLADKMTSLEPRGDRTVEALGLKVPAAEFVRWGGLLLVVTQLYFCLHLWEFARRSQALDPGYDVAWIGIYRSPIAASAAFASSCILPPSGLAFVIAQSEFDGIWIPIQWRTSALAAALGGVCILLAVATAWGLHQVRSVLQARDSERGSESGTAQSRPDPECDDSNG